MVDRGHLVSRRFRRRVTDGSWRRRVGALAGLPCPCGSELVGAGAACREDAVRSPRATPLPERAHPRRPRQLERWPRRPRRCVTRTAPAPPGPCSGPRDWDRHRAHERREGRRPPSRSRPIDTARRPARATRSRGPASPDHRAQHGRRPSRRRSHGDRGWPGTAAAPTDPGRGALRAVRPRPVRAGSTAAARDRMPRPTGAGRCAPPGVHRPTRPSTHGNSDGTGGLGHFDRCQVGRSAARWWRPPWRAGANPARVAGRGRP